jgi:RNA polymerase sigma-70 factor (ECF subfamily)
MKEQIQQDAFLNTYNLNKNKLLASSVKIVKDKHAAEDIIQETFLRLYKQDYAKIKDHIELWLFTVCRNLSIKYYHKQGKISLLGDDFDDDIEDEKVEIPIDSLMAKERVRKLLKLYRKLPKRQLAAIKYRYYKDLDYTQIAKKMKTTTGNVGFMLSTGISSLRSLFAKEKKNHIEY